MTLGDCPAAQGSAVRLMRRADVGCIALQMGAQDGKCEPRHWCRVGDRKGRGPVARSARRPGGVPRPRSHPDMALAAGAVLCDLLERTRHVLDTALRPRTARSPHTFIRPRPAVSLPVSRLVQQPPRSANSVRGGLGGLTTNERDPRSSARSRRSTRCRPRGRSRRHCRGGSTATRRRPRRRPWLRTRRRARH